MNRIQHSAVLYISYNAKQYSAGGDHALIDGILGVEDFRTGTWQGYSDTDLNALVDLGKEKVIQTLSISFLRDQRSWIFLPKQVRVYTSLDGLNFKRVGNWKEESPTDTDDVKMETILFSNLGNARDIKVLADKLAKLPKWHLGASYNGNTWLFVDEIQIK